VAPLVRPAGTAPEACGRPLAAWELESQSWNLRFWLEVGSLDQPLLSLVRLHQLLTRSVQAVGAANLALGANQCWALRAQMMSLLVEMTLATTTLVLSTGGAVHHLLRAEPLYWAVLPVLPLHLAALLALPAGLVVLHLAQQH